MPVVLCAVLDKIADDFSGKQKREYGGEGGVTRFARRYSAHPWASPLRGQRKRCSKALQAFLCGQSNGLRPLSNPGRGFSSPQRVQYAKKKPVLSYELFLKYGGEGGIRTPDTLPYTHFPGVLLQPLGHLTILYCCLTAWGATGRYYRELRENGQAVFTLCFSFGYALYIFPDVSRRGSDLAL